MGIKLKGKIIMFTFVRVLVFGKCSVIVPYLK